MAVTTSRKQKKWYKIEAPEVLNNAELGESYVASIDQLVGKTLTVNLSSITNNMRKQNVEVHFKVVSSSDKKGVTDIRGVTLTGSNLKRLVRKGRDKIEDSFIVTTQNNKDIRIKPVILTNTNANKSVRKTLRKMAKDFLNEYAKKNPHDTFFDAIINNRIQKEMKDKLADIYPLKYVDIRHAMVEDTLETYETEDTEEQESIEESEEDVEKAEEAEE